MWGRELEIAARKMREKPREPAAAHRGVVHQIQIRVAEAYGIATADLRRSHGSRLTTEAKRQAIQLARAEGFSLTQIGYLFGGMHHTSVRYYLKAPPKEPRALMPPMAQRVTQLETAVSGLMLEVAALTDEVRRLTSAAAPCAPVQPEPSTPVRSKPIDSARGPVEETNTHQRSPAARTQKQAG